VPQDAGRLRQARRPVEKPKVRLTAVSAGIEARGQPEASGQWAEASFICARYMTERHFPPPWTIEELNDA